MVELDLEKILSLPDGDSQQTELTQQLHDQIEKFGAITTSESALIGFVASLVMNMMHVRDYIDHIGTILNRSNFPFLILNFSDWFDTKDMTPDEMHAWVERKKLEQRANQPMIIHPH